MDERMKQRLVGAAVLVLAAVIFVPMLLDQDDGDPKLPARIIQRSPPEPEPPLGTTTAPEGGLMGCTRLYPRPLTTLPVGRRPGAGWCGGCA